MKVAWRVGRVGRVGFVGLVLAAACGMSSQTPPGPSPVTPTFSVLVFSKTAGFRHDSIPAGIDAVRQQGSARGFSVDASEDAACSRTNRSRKYKAVVFLSTTGDVLNPAQEAAFERFIRRGGGFVGVHSATDTEYDWPFYGALVGAYFAGHPDIQNATIQIEDSAHPAVVVAAASVDAPRRVVQLPAKSARQRHRARHAGRAHLHAAGRWRPTIRSSGRTPTKAGGPSTPPLGHTQESFSEASFVEHLGRAILWAAGAI